MTENSYTKKIGWANIILGAIFCILSICMFCNLFATDMLIVIIAGISFLISGIAHFVMYAKLHKIQDGCGILIVQGVLDVILGLLFLSNLVIGMATINFILGFGFVFCGIIAICSVFNKMVREATPWGAILALGIINLILGISWICGGWGFIVLPILAGIAFLVNGIKMIIDGAQGSIVKK